jgi:hypothetical protein
MQQPLCKRIIVRCEFIHQQKKAYPVKLLCKVMEVGRYKARTLMQNASVFCVQRRRFKVTPHIKLQKISLIVNFE